MRVRTIILLLLSVLALAFIWACEADRVLESSLPNAGFSMTPDSGAAPLEVSFTDLSTEEPLAWLWDFGDGYISHEQNPTHVYASAGRYTVSLSAYNQVGGDEEKKESCICVEDTSVIDVRILPWYDLYVYQRIINTTPDTVETTYVEGNLWSNWEPVLGQLMSDGTIAIYWDTLDLWGNPYTGDLAIALNETRDEVESFSVEAFVSEGTTAWGTRHIVFEGHNIEREDSSAAGMLFRVWGAGAYPRIDSFSQHMYAHDGSIDWLTTGFICVESSRVEIRITYTP